MPDLIAHHLADVVAVAVSTLLVLAYGVSIAVRARRQGDRVVHSFAARMRARWVEKTMSDAGSGILAVQTLRNSVMAASFMASTSALLMMGTLSFTSNFESLAMAFAPAAVHSPAWDAIKLAALVVTFFVAFYQFAMSVRFFNHVGYMINVRGEDAGHGVARVVAFLNRAGAHYTRGVRVFFGCLPLALWLIGPIGLVAGTFGLLVAYGFLDHGPRG